MAILDENSIDFISTSEAQTMRLGVRLGELIAPRDVICLTGELGSGKTALARGIGRGWGSANRVTSPSYVLINEYPRLRDGAMLYHLDCYRLDGAREALTAGVEDILAAPAVVMIEWAERIEAMLPADRLWIALRYISETRRGVRITPHGDRSLALLKEFRQRAFGI